MPIFALLLALALALLPDASFAGESETEDQPVPDSVRDTLGPLRRTFGRPQEKEPLFLALKEKLKDYPPFIADTQLLIHYRTYYRNKKRLEPEDSEAWAMGGWFGYRSGKLFDLLSAEIKGFGSFPIYAPDDRDGTQLLKPDQQGIAVLGVANATLSWREIELTGGRMEFGSPYVNRNDNRMVPNTFEAITLRDRVGAVQAGIAYIRSIKPRDSDDFVSITERVAPEEDGGMLSAAGYWQPNEDFYLGGINHFAFDVFNTLYLEGGFVVPLGQELAAEFEMQFTDQRSVGEELDGSFDTQNYGIRASASALGAILRLGYSQTATGSRVRNPWGSNPSYVSTMQRNFVRAGEKAALASLSWDLSRVGIPHVSGFVRYVEAWDAELEGVEQPRSRAVDATFDYKIREGMLRGFWFRARGSWLGEQESRSSAYDVRLIINYELPLL